MCALAQQLELLSVIASHLLLCQTKKAKKNTFSPGAPAGQLAKPTGDKALQADNKRISHSSLQHARLRSRHTECRHNLCISPPRRARVSQMAPAALCLIVALAAASAIGEIE